MNFDFKNGLGDGFGMVYHHLDLVGIVGPDTEEFAGGEGQLDPALALVAPEIVLGLAAEDRQSLGGGDLHPLGAGQHDVDVQEFLVGLEEALLVGDGVKFTYDTIPDEESFFSWASKKLSSSGMVS